MTVGVLVFLLRGINVGGSGRLPMFILRGIAGELGMTNPRTYIQSGNLVARWDREPHDAAEALRGAITATAGFAPAVHARTAGEVRHVVESNPFVVEGIDAKELHVTFLETDAAAVIDEADVASFEPERAVAIGRELYLHLPQGIGRSPLGTAVGRTRAGRHGTIRNWRTLTEIASMLDEST